MNSSSRFLAISRLCTAGLLLGSVGCTQVATRQSTLEMSNVPAFAGSPAQKIQPPAAVTKVRPEYPLDLKRAGIEGEVQLVCLIDENGAVQSVTVKDYTHSGLTDAAVKAMKQWTFKPALRDGAPVPMRVNIPINFRINAD